MKVAVITIPMRLPEKVGRFEYSVDGDKAIEYRKPILCPVNAVLAKTLKKDEEVKVIYVLTTGKHSSFEQNLVNFRDELEGINAEIGAKLSFDTIKIEFRPVKATFNKILTELADKIPDDAEIYADITFGDKPSIVSLLCAIKFAEEFRDAVVQYVVYGKIEFYDEDDKKTGPVIFDITSLYYFFNLIGSMRASDAESAFKKLKNFFNL